MASLLTIASQPGVQRDGTRFASKVYADALWCRFQRGMPRKIGGYRSVTNQMTEIVYGLNSFTVNNTQYMHLGSASLLTQRRLAMGVQTGFHDRTPGGMVASADNIWQLDSIFDVNLADTAIVGQVAPNMDIASDDAQPIWYGTLTGTALLTDTGMTPVSGGVVTIGNYLVSFGSGGYVQWNTTANNLTGGTDESFPGQQKIVAGRKIRGGGVPAGLLWSLDELIQMTLNAGGTPIWDFDSLGEISIMSSRGVQEDLGVYYWPGVDRWYMYNGVIREIPNTFNQNFFFDRLNFEQRQKLFSFKVPRFGEIWWCFPLDDSEVPDHAVILNTRENCWYDTALPNSGRSDGIYAKVYNKPFMTGVDIGGAGYVLWEHESGKNQVVGSSVEPIQSYFETAEFSLPGNSEQPEDIGLSIGMIEPDFVQVGDLTATLRGRANARAKIIETDPPQTITEQQSPEVGVAATEQVAYFKNAFRLVSFKIQSNTPDGDYQLGQMLAHVDKAGARVTQ